MKLFRLIFISFITILFSSCVQEIHLKTLTFKVDMTNVENAENVGIRGNFTNKPWKETAPLTDENNDGIYEGTFTQETAANQVEFKFVNQNSDFELKGSDNRTIQFEYKPETIVYEAVFNTPESKILKLD